MFGAAANIAGRDTLTRRPAATLIQSNSLPLCHCNRRIMGPHAATSTPDRPQQLAMNGRKSSEPRLCSNPLIAEPIINMCSSRES